MRSYSAGDEFVRSLSLRLLHTRRRVLCQTRCAPFRAESCRSSSWRQAPCWRQWTPTTAPCGRCASPRTRCAASLALLPLASVVLGSNDDRMVLCSLLCVIGAEGHRDWKRRQDGQVLGLWADQGQKQRAEVRHRLGFCLWNSLLYFGLRHCNLCMCMCVCVMQASDAETHAHAAAGRGRPVCEVFPWPQAAGRLAARLHRQDLLLRHTQGASRTHTHIHTHNKVSAVGISKGITKYSFKKKWNYFVINYLLLEVKRRHSNSREDFVSSDSIFLDSNQMNSKYGCIINLPDCFVDR